MIDRRSLRFRLTVLYTGVASIVLVTAGLAVIFTVFAFVTRPIALSLAQAVRNVEASAAAAPASESVDTIERRIAARETRNGIVAIAIPVSAARDTPTRLPAGEFSVVALLSMSPQFVHFRNAAVVVIPEQAKIHAVMRAYFTVAGLSIAPALLIAWVVARIVTRETLKPLLTVTAELERFASGDFTPRPLKAADQTEFGALARAYNGAAIRSPKPFSNGAGSRRKSVSSSRKPVTSCAHH